MRPARHSVRRPSAGRRLVAPAALATVAYLVVVMLALAPAPARADSATDEAEALIRQGTELRHQKQDAKALPLFERAYSLVRNPRTAAQLGLAKMSLGYWLDAERLLDEALGAPDHPWIASNLKVLEQSRVTVRKNIGELVVTGGPAGAELLVNGRPAGRLPLAGPLRLDRGPVEIVLRAPGHTAASRTIQLGGGARESVSVTLERAGAPA